MVNDKHSITSQCDQQDKTTDLTENQNNDVNNNDNILPGDESEVEFLSLLSDAISKEDLEKLSCQLKETSEDVKCCLEKLTILDQGVKELKSGDRVIMNLSNQFKELNEQFHEREVMLPLIHRIIRVADRNHQQIENYQKTLVKQVRNKNESTARAVKLLIDSKKADLIDLEDALADMGVESYVHDGMIFDPTLHKTISRIQVDDEVLNEHIAHRLLPGYKRYGRIIRKEYVNVYVHVEKTNQDNKGGDQ